MLAIAACLAWSCAAGSIDPAPPQTSKASIDLPERRVILSAPAAASASTGTQGATDIFLVEMQAESAPWKVEGVVRVTDRDGYDNQPYFEEDGESLLFVSMRDGQTDVFRYRLESGDAEPGTATAESEYSPTPVPAWPGFSTVRVEADGTQRLWRFPSAPGEGRDAELVFEAIAPVGYHAWIDEKTVALFVLGEPNRLVVADVATGKSRQVATGIGRSLHRVPGRRGVSFVDKSDPDRWWIVLLDLETGAQRRVVETPAGREDFLWWSPREILVGDGSKLYLFDLDLAQFWREVADLSDHGIDGITRLSRSPIADRLAVVGERVAVDKE